jgi:MSHA biogenesis protein MshI
MDMATRMKSGFGFAFKKTAAVKKPLGLCSLQLAKDGLAIAHVTWEEQVPTLTHCEFIPLDLQNPAEILSVLPEHVKKHHLQGARCSWILQPSDYTIIPVGSLPVSPNEVEQAIRWHVRNQLDFPVTEAIVTHFTTPHKTHTAQEDFIYAVVTKKDFIQPLSSLIHECNLSLEIIDIPEFALRNLMHFSQYKKRSIGLIEADEAKSTLMIIQKGLIYLFRQIEWDKKDSTQESIAKLSTELQRSLDYYESELGQSLVEHFYLSPNYPSLHASLKEGLPLTLEDLEIGQLLNISLSKEEENRCFAAIGGALRHEEHHETAN